MQDPVSSWLATPPSSSPAIEDRSGENDLYATPWAGAARFCFGSVGGASPAGEHPLFCVNILTL